MDSLVPPNPTLRVGQSKQRPTRAVLEKLDHLLILLPAALSTNQWPSVPAGKQLAKLAAHSKADAVPRARTRLTNGRATGITVICFDTNLSSFKRLTRARRAIAEVLRDHPGSLGLFAPGFDAAEQRKLIESIILAASAAVFRLPSFKSETSRERRLRQVKILSLRERIDLHPALTAQGHNNLARWLTALPPNQLTAQSYQAVVKQLVAEKACRYSFLNEKKLAQLGAGAFLAVSQGNRTRDAGIIRLSYRPEGSAQSERPLALVGKGILFDTGGTNLKPFKSMLEMHMDMAGSAVALAAFLSFAELGVPYPIEAWLAVTENRISAAAYKSQDVVTAANGKTIQVIHTDAEGRMVLADTLALAGREKPALILDFATLTGSCVAALTERYSGIFSNRPGGYDYLLKAGIESGERVWPFPMDADYDRDLSSDVADIKQCAASGYGDHILAARFLSKFIPKSIPWVHMDLSAGHRKGGLGHIPTLVTGFGVRYATHLLDRAGSPAALAKELDRV